MSMKKPSGNNHFIRLYRMLLDARWFFSFTASGCATIVGITLTFGINSCREQQRQKEEMKKSMLQATDNLRERFENVNDWIASIERQNQVYSIADSLYFSGSELADTLCDEFRYTMPIIRLSAFDHEFEKIFRGSYQLWQMKGANDSLAFYIGECYDGLNIVEATCETLTEGMLEQIGVINARDNFYRLPPKEWTVKLLESPEFQYYMSVRKVKARIASDILQMAFADYENNVVVRAKGLIDER